MLPAVFRRFFWTSWADQLPRSTGASPLYKSFDFFILRLKKLDGIYDLLDWIAIFIDRKEKRKFQIFLSQFFSHTCFILLRLFFNRVLHGKHSES